VSTDLDNLDWLFPLRLLASAFVADPDVDTVVLVLVGVVGAFGWLERRFGTAWAFGVFLAIHVVATLVTLLVVVTGVRTGFYPPEVRDDLDYGISYGAIGCTGAIVWFLPKWARVPAALAEEVLSFFGERLMGYRWDQPAYVLSYANRRRLEIARALAARPRLLLLDEPAAGLDPASSVALFTLVKKLHEDLGLTVLLVEHYVKAVLENCDLVYVLNEGRLIASGPPREIAVDPEVRRAYFGTDDDEDDETDEEVVDVDA